MKRIINGKVYNTETAEYIGSYHNGLHPNDFRYLDEELYVTKKETYFIAGKGSALTYYSRLKNGCGIRVITKAEALKWLEEHEMYEEIEEYFSDILEEG